MDDVRCSKVLQSILLLTSTTQPNACCMTSDLLEDQENVFSTNVGSRQYIGNRVMSVNIDRVVREGTVRLRCRVR
jgi:hypothetical protein